MTSPVAAFASEDAFAEFWYSLQATTGATPTCWRPPCGDVDDRIRYIANALGLETVIWKFGSNDWRVGTNNITPADVDANYAYFIAILTAGDFNSGGAIMLTHELTNYTMQEAINWYPALKGNFSALVPIGVALNMTQPYQETNYSLPTFQQYVSGQITANSTNSANTTTSSGSSPSSGSPSSQKKKSSGSTVAVSSGSVVGRTLPSAAAGLLLSGLAL